MGHLRPFFNRKGVTLLHTILRLIYMKMFSPQSIKYVMWLWSPFYSFKIRRIRRMTNEEAVKLDSCT